MKVLLGHLDWGLSTKDPHYDPADKTFLVLCIVSNVSKWSNLLLKNGVKTSVAGSCTSRLCLLPLNLLRTAHATKKLILPSFREKSLKIAVIKL